jgi:thiol:disulfide interchange protein
VTGRLGLSLVASLIALWWGGVVTDAQRGPARADVQALVERTPAAGGSTVHAALRVHLPEGYHTNSNKPRDPSLIPITLTFASPPPGIAITEVVFPEAKDFIQRGAPEPLRVFDGDFTIGVAIAVAPDAPAGTVELSAALRYQACDEVACYIPVRVPATWSLTVAATAGSSAHADVFGPIRFGTGEPPTLTGAPAATALAPTTPAPRDDAAALERFTTRGTATGYLGTDDFLAFIKNAEAGVQERGMFEGRGPIAVLLLVLVGGLALNLTPCVLPMIPINLAIIGAGAQAGSRSRGLLLGAAYGAAMAMVYGALGLIVVLTASTFGTINSYWWFNAGIAMLFVVLALAMFDVISIDFSRLSEGMRIADSRRGSFAVAFGMGAVAALLAGACVAPVVIQVVLFSSDLYAAGSTVALALPFLLGVGMAIPWPIAGAGIAALPRPGAWMVRIKQAFGVVILATAAYYGYEAYSIASNRWVDGAEVSSSVQEKLKAGWHQSLAEGLAVAEREKKPVLVDMWATWCKNCLVMDRTTLEDPAITGALSGYVKVKFEADPPDNPTVAKVMQKLGARGLPTYVILQSGH